MKTAYLAFGAFTLLLLAGGYLLIQTDMDKRMESVNNQMNQQKEMLAKQNELLARMARPQAPAQDTTTRAGKTEPGEASTAGTQPSSDNAVAPIAPLEEGAPLPNAQLDPADAELKTKLAAAEEEKRIIDKKLEEIRAGNAEQNPAALNPTQAKILNLPSIAKIVGSYPDQGFVELNAGKAQQLEQGQTYQVRRKSQLIGDVVITKTVEEHSCIADIVAKSVPTGVVLEKGDEVIQFR